MRCNAGIDPFFLADQHLCELSELKMVPGTLKRINLQPKGIVPTVFKLNAGHIGFFYNKLEYLEKRHKAIHRECINRGRSGLSYFYSRRDIPSLFWNDWAPSIEDSAIVRKRIFGKLVAKPGYWRYNGKIISDIVSFANRLVDSPLYHV